MWYDSYSCEPSKIQKSNKPSKPVKPIKPVICRIANILPQVYYVVFPPCLMQRLNMVYKGQSDIWILICLTLSHISQHLQFQSNISLPRAFQLMEALNLLKEFHQRLKPDLLGIGAPTTVSYETKTCIFLLLLELCFVSYFGVESGCLTTSEKRWNEHIMQMQIVGLRRQSNE